MKREISALIAALLSMEIGYLLFSRSLKPLVYSRFWIDEHLVVGVALLLTAIVGTLVFEAVRKAPPPWSIVNFKPLREVSYLGATMAAFLASGLIVGLTMGYRAELGKLSFSEEVAAQIGGLLILAAHEELMFRGVLLGALVAITRSSIAGLFLATAVFAIMHPGKDFLLMFSGGLWFGSIALSTRSIWPAVAAHFSGNLGIQILFDRNAITSSAIYDHDVFFIYSRVATAALFLASFITIRSIATSDPLFAIVRRKIGQRSVPRDQ